LALHTRLTTCLSRKLRSGLSAVFCIPFGLPQAVQILFPPLLGNSFPHRKQFRMLINGVVSIIYKNPLISYISVQPTENFN
jgi:hypothetical protein